MKAAFSATSSRKATNVKWYTRGGCYGCRQRGVKDCFYLMSNLAEENDMVADNVIEELPHSICNLTHLKSLGLDNNKLRQLPGMLLKECISLQSLSVHGNSLTMDQLQQMEGFQEYEGRRKKKFDKQIDANVFLGSKALDEGVDLRLNNQ